MPEKTEMRAAGQAMRAYVENDPLIIALKDPAIWAAGAVLAAASVGCAHIACRVAAAMAGI